MEREAMVILPCLCTAGAPRVGCALPLSLGAEISGKSLRTSSYCESQSLFSFESQRKQSQYEGIIHRLCSECPGPI